MSAHTLTEIRCDICDEATSEWNTTRAQLRRWLQADGWKQRAGWDICPTCVTRQEMKR